MNTSAIELAEPTMLGWLTDYGLDAEYVRSSGNTLFAKQPDGSERPVLDFAGGYGSLLFGHNHPRASWPAPGSLVGGDPVHAQFSRHPYAKELATRLNRVLHREFGATSRTTTIFANSGAEAVEAAVKHAETGPRASRCGERRRGDRGRRARRPSRAAPWPRAPSAPRRGRRRLRRWCAELESVNAERAETAAGAFDAGGRLPRQAGRQRPADPQPGLPHAVHGAGPDHAVRAVQDQPSRCASSFDEERVAARVAVVGRRVADGDPDHAGAVRRSPSSRSRARAASRRSSAEFAGEIQPRATRRGVPRGRRRDPERHGPHRQRSSPARRSGCAATTTRCPRASAAVWRRRR